MKTIVPVLVGVTLALASAAGHAQEAAKDELKVSIERKSLRDALNDWAQQTGNQLIAEIKGEFVAPKVEGKLTAQEALDRLLEGTPLTYQWMGERLVAVKEKPLVMPAALQSTAVTSTQRRVRVAQLDGNDDTSGKERRVAAPSAADPPASTAQRSRAADDMEADLEVVVVTAQKRLQRLQDVPISISVLGGNQLDTSTAQGITESLTRVPGVMAQESYIGGGTQVAIRGVAASGPILLGSSPIAYYLDSVPFGLINTSIAPDANAYDMERVEVLRGPQGTLYGASALNGVVRVLTKDANLDRLEFKSRGSISSTNDGGENYRGDMAVNVPIVQGKLAARAVVGYESFSGWVDRPNEEDANDADLRNVRLKVNGQPTDALSVGVSVWVSRADYGAPPQSLDDGQHSSLHDEPMTTDYETYGLKVGYDLSSVSVNAMTSYLEYENSGSLDLVPWIGFDTPFVNQFSSELFSQEIVLNSNGSSSWRWSLGGIYRDATDNVFQTIEGIFPAPVDYDITSQSFAVFGELTRTFLDGRLELTGGLRYFEDDVRTRENEPSTGVPTDPLIRERSKFDAVTPRVVLTWHPSEPVTLYASYAEGFRSGFQQQPNVLRVAPNLPPVDADSLKNYEVGAKSSFLDRRVNMDAAVYYIDWQDVQNQFGVNLSGGIVLGALANSGSASGVGADFALMTEPLDGLQLGFTFGWNDLTWDNPVLFANTVLFEKGARLNLSPEYTIGAIVDYVFPLRGSGLEGRFSASGNHISEQEFKTNFGQGLSDNILIARTSFSVESKNRWAATVYVDNVNDERGAVIVPPFGVPDWTQRARPRTVGLQLEYQF